MLDGWEDTWRDEQMSQGTGWGEDGWLKGFGVSGWVTPVASAEPRL